MIRKTMIKHPPASLLNKRERCIRYCERKQSNVPLLLEGGLGDEKNAVVEQRSFGY